jgi:hypothetical protein
MPAPTLGDAYLTVTTALPASPANAAEAMPNLDPAFMTAWNSAKYPFPDDWMGDNSFISAVALVAYRYKNGYAGGPTAPTVSGISPTTGVNSVGFTLTVTGTKFDPNAVVLFGTTRLTPKTASPTQLVVDVPAALIPTATTYPVSAINADGSASATTNFTAT